MFEITRDYRYCAAHQIPGHPKCGRLHGHNYLVKVTFAGKELNHQGMLIDFADMDKYVKPLINALDHRYTLPTRTPPPPFLAMLDEDEICRINASSSTAEEMARYFANYVRADLQLGGVDWVERVGIVIYETDKNSAQYTVEL